MKTQIDEFCSLHSACQDGREWATANCQTMREAWGKARPDWVVWIATRPGVLTNKELKLFAVHCARAALAIVTNPDLRSVEAVNVAERHANGQATGAELSAAARSAAAVAHAAAAYDAAAARSAAYAAAAAHAAAHAAAAHDAAHAAAYAAAAAHAAAVAHAAAAHAAAVAHAAAAAENRQAEYLRANCNPTF
jgi:hypothetical protein